MGFQARGNRRRTLRGNNKATSINDIVIAIFLALKERKSSSLPCFNWKRTRIEGCFQSCKVCKRNSCDPTAPVEVRTQKLETGLHRLEVGWLHIMSTPCASSFGQRFLVRLGTRSLFAVPKIFPIHF